MSDWRTVQEVNGGINHQLRYMRTVAEYLKSYQADDDEELADVINDLLSRIQQQQEVLKMGYLDSGYRYDDHDPRNLMDLYDDNYEHRNSARNGSSARDEMIAEIARQVAEKDFQASFDTAMSAVPGLSQHMSDMSDYWLEDVWDYSDDDHAY